MTIEEGYPFKAEPTVDALKVRYQELHTHFRSAVDAYLKGSTVGLAILGAALGYILQARLAVAHARLATLCVLVILLLWYVCSIWALRLYNSLIASMSQSAAALLLDFDELDYKVFKVLIFSGMAGGIPIALILIYLLIYPPPM